MLPRQNLKVFVVLSLLTLGCGTPDWVGSSHSEAKQLSKGGRWMSGDFHTHTFLTDGSHREAEIVENAFERLDLDWMATSEHGGIYDRDESGRPIPPEWRWRSLRDRSYPLVKQLREETKYQNRLLIQGVEWNVPTHEHASVGVVTDEPKQISDFEYQFDAKDLDTSPAVKGLLKQHSTHQDALAAVRWLEAHAPTTSYLVFRHNPTITHFR